jgi:hypothetical protein
MSLTPVSQNDLESFSVIANPIRQYSSSSMGVTGSVHVFARRSSIEKDVTSLPGFVDATKDDSDLNATIGQLTMLGRLAKYVSTIAEKFPGMLDDYLSKVDSQAISARKQKILDIIRFTPSVNFSSNTTRKLIVKDILMKYYRTSYPSAHWAYSNYNSLNFFTASSVPTSSVLLYPNYDVSMSDQAHEGYVALNYSLSGSFSFDFYINPRYQTEEPNGQFKAGTIMHVSSCYALSLVTGSAKDQNGRPLGYRLLLQLSHSADTRPSEALPGNYPNDLVFLSDDNSLQWNRWHHVVVRWGTSLINQGTGSFNIDGVDKGLFVIPSGTVAPLLFGDPAQGMPSVLCVGNYWEGTNKGNNEQSLFFAADPALREGLTQLNGTVGIDAPISAAVAFNHPLNAELHDVALKRFYMSNDDIVFSASQGPKLLDWNLVAFYLPPFFIQESPFRQFVGTHGGIMQTPFFEVDGTTQSPFNVAMSFGVNGHYINIENYLRDFASDVFPRAHDLSASVIDYTTEARAANDFLYDDPKVRARNLLILPCDDGNFIPAYELLASESLRTIMVGDDGVEELSYVHLGNMLSTASILFGSAFEDVEGVAAADADRFIDELIGFTPEQPGNQPGRAYVGFMRKLTQSVASGTYIPGVENNAPLTIYQRTRDPSSNQVTFFDVSNLYYGQRIMPGTLELYESGMTGSNGRVPMTLKDDGNGNIYRADTFTSASTWNSVGNVFYDEGIIVIKNPHLYFYGKDHFEVSFRGVQSIHSLKLEVIAAQNQLNSSSNPNFKLLPASGFKTDNDPNYVYITGLNFHDENLNVVAKTQLAQPIVKRHGDRILFKVGIDF